MPAVATGSFAAITSDDVDAALDCRWQSISVGDSFEWPVEPADRVLAGLDGELVHVTELGSGPECDDED